MKMKKLFFSLAVSFCLSIGIHAQDAQPQVGQIYEGTVLDETGLALPGASITLIGTGDNYESDESGKFQFTAKPGDSILVNFMGYEPAKRYLTEGTDPVGINLIKSKSTNELQEVVVTALGIKREKKALGYAVDEIKGDEVSQVKLPNVTSALSGKSAGLRIVNTNNFGGSVNVTIRGNNSLLGNNQALWVVDGVPINNSSANTAAQRGGGRGYDFGNAASDINPEDIENISVLKGAAATALWGSRGSNGVILITTKRSSKKPGQKERIGVSFSSNVGIGTIDKSTFLTYQKGYGAGYYMPHIGKYGKTGVGFDDQKDIDGDGKNDLVVPVYVDGSYGAPFDPNLNVYQWDSFVPKAPNYKKKYSWQAAENDPTTFFETAINKTNTVELSGYNEKGSFRIGYTNYQSKGVLPNSNLDKNTVNFNGDFQISERIKTFSTVNYVNQNVLGQGSTGYSDNLMTEMRQWWQTNVDIKTLEQVYKDTKLNYTWNPASVNDPLKPEFWDNPYWTRYENYATSERSRWFGNVGFKYDILKNEETGLSKLDLMVRATIDTYNEVREERRAVGSVPTSFGILGNDESSGYARNDIFVSDNNYDVHLNYNERFDEVSVVGLAGMNIRRERYESIIQSTNGGLVNKGIYAISNSRGTVPFPIETLTEKQVNGYFVNVSTDYKGLLYLDLTDRVDISSSLPVDNNMYNYYSGAFSFIFSELIEDIDFFKFGKLRASYAEVGSDTGAQNIYDTFSRRFSFNDVVLYSGRGTKNNSTLLPERSKSTEIGLETKYTINNQNIGLDVTWYKTNTIDQILDVTISTTTGYSRQYVNAGELQNTGLEINFNAEVLKLDDFVWEFRANWSKNVNTVENLYSGISNIQLNSYQGGVTLNATKGEKYGTIRGTGFVYDQNGNKIVNSKGSGYLTASDQVIGVAQPDWTSGITNSFTYKGVNLSFLIDISKGGDLYSLDMHYGQSTGLVEHTGGVNDLGNPLRDPVTDDKKSGGLILEGVKITSDDYKIEGNKLVSGTTKENDVRGKADTYAGVYYWGNSGRNPAQKDVYDASFVKLREVTLGYSLPLGAMGVENIFSNVSINAYGRNLWIIYKNLPYADPEAGLSAGNAQGYIAGAYPTVRTFGFGLKLDF